MKISVLLFAKARDLAGAHELVVEIPDGSMVSDLKSQIVEQYPSLAAIGYSLIWAVNNRYASDETVLDALDTVACFPPVSGG